MKILTGKEASVAGYNHEGYEKLVHAHKLVGCDVSLHQ